MRWYLTAVRLLPVVALAALVGGVKFGFLPAGWSRGA